MKTQITFISLIALILFSFSLTAQDVITKRNSEVINCKVKEIGVDVVKYTLPDYPEDVLFSVENDKILKIVFENGKEKIFEIELENPENYLENRKNAIKIDFISPLTGNTTLGYERSIKPGQSIEAALGIIGLGSDPNDVNPTGFFVKFGYKFIKSPDFYMRGMRYAHILKGGYIKPEIMFGNYSKDFDHYEYSGYPYYNSTYSSERKNITSGGIMLNLGKQWVYSNAFLVDFYVGVGYGFDSDDYEDNYHYGFVTVAEDVPLAFTAGLKIGFLFK